MLPSLQHFKGRKACWSFGMGLEQTHKQEFKIKSTCTTKKRERLVQVEHKWCDGFSKDKFKHKLYTAHNLWEEAPLCSLQYILKLFTGTTSKWHFFLRFSSASPNFGTFVVLKLWMLISFSNQFVWNKQVHYFITLKKIFLVVYCAPIRDNLTPVLRGFVVGSQIFNLTFALSFDHNSCISCLNEQCV